MCAQGVKGVPHTMLGFTFDWEPSTKLAFGWWFQYQGLLWPPTSNKRPCIKLAAQTPPRSILSKTHFLPFPHYASLTSLEGGWVVGLGCRGERSKLHLSECWGATANLESSPAS